MLTFFLQMAFNNVDLPTFGLPTNDTKPERISTGYVCNNDPVQQINFKRWFDRMQPQTLQIATWLLYFDGFFALVDLLDGYSYLRYIRETYRFGFVFGLVNVALYAAGGLLMANERKIGYKIAIAASISPFVVRFIAVQNPLSDSLISLAFDVALVALLLHTQSREHQRIWYR
jgi:hypothetical protein